MVKDATWTKRVEWGLGVKDMVEMLGVMKAWRAMAMLLLDVVA